VPVNADGSLMSPTSSNVSPRSSVASAAADTIQRLDLRSSAPVPALGLLPSALGRPGAHALSAPPSKVPSRDASPAREGSLSPTRGPAGGADASAALLNGKRPPIKGESPEPALPACPCFYLLFAEGRGCGSSLLANLPSISACSFPQPLVSITAYRCPYCLQTRRRCGGRQQMP
jgi:hypothetical protein